MINRRYEHDKCFVVFGIPFGGVGGGSRAAGFAGEEVPKLGILESYRPGHPPFRIVVAARAQFRKGGLVQLE